ncbi:MAG: LysM peptidoglycan-binding domain-containing protein [Verrucomicrobia bacterium]|nr:LysM peptidoglycan-binding domain-containing protein [Verrucomicrobiota bacterium]
MNFSPTIRLALVLAGALCWQGCSPGGSTAVDEQKEPHYLRGLGLASSFDHKGAIAAFGKALEVNPRSASAHFELALLLDKHENNPAAAIYHFEKFLELKPNSDRADIIRPRITACKQELAKSFLLTTGTQNAQPELEKLKLELERIVAENMQLRRQLEQLPVAPVAPKAGAARAPGPSPSAPANPPPAPRAAGEMKTYAVKAGDNPGSIARRHGITLEALKAANPNLNPTKLQIGQSLNIPPP